MRLEDQIRESVEDGCGAERDADENRKRPGGGARGRGSVVLVHARQHSTGRRIVYSRPDGGVSVVCPAPECLRALTGGGGYVAPRDRDLEVARFARAGVGEDVAARWIDGLVWGGKTTAEAYGLLRDKDVPAGARDVAVRDISFMPRDRWFRDAWRLGREIVVDLEAARPIQFRRIVDARRGALARAEGEVFGHNSQALYDEIAEMNVGAWREKVIAARSVAELRAMWPGCLGRAA